MRYPRMLFRAAAVAAAGVALAAPAYPAEAAPARTPAPSVEPTAGPAPRPPGTSPPASLEASPVPPAQTSAPPSATPAPAAPAPERGGGRGLPVTGAQVGGMVVLGGGLIATGIAMVAVRRRDLSGLDLADTYE